MKIYMKADREKKAKYYERLKYSKNLTQEDEEKFKILVAQKNKTRKAHAALVAQKRSKPDKSSSICGSSSIATNIDYR